VVVRRQVLPWEWVALTNALGLESFGWGLDRLTPEDRRRLDRLRRRAVFAEEGQMRVYPLTNLLGSVLGFVGAGTNGCSVLGAGGIEWALQSELAGTVGVCISEQDAAGNERPDRRVYYRPCTNGNHVVLAVDVQVQQIAERALAAAAARHNPRYAAVLVLRPRTGEILGWAEVPEVSPQYPGQGPAETWRIHGAGDRLEPGSVGKVLTLAAGLNEGLIRLDDRVYCERGRFPWAGLVLHDHGAHGWLTVREAFARSSNIGFAKLALLLGPERLYGYLTNFGLDRATGIGLPGEAAGYLPRLAEWTSVTLTRAGIGQGIALTQLQLTLAVGAMGNEGRLMRPILVLRVESPEGRVVWEQSPQVVRAVVRPEVARQVLEAMEGVVSAKGTGAGAALPLHRVAGKTGTAQKSDRTGYLAGRYEAWFVGLFPASQPEVVISVLLDEPRNGYYGGSVAAPVFREVAAGIAPVLGIRADKDGKRPSSGPEGQRDVQAILGPAQQAKASGAVEVAGREGMKLVRQ
jgi:cell division protein FtsI/penicillin-binding protein 2